MIGRLHTVIFPTGGCAPQEVLLEGLRGTRWGRASPALERSPARRGPIWTAPAGSDWGLLAVREDDWPGHVLPWLLERLSAELEGRVGHWQHNDDYLDSGSHH